MMLVNGGRATQKWPAVKPQSEPVERILEQFQRSEPEDFSAADDPQLVRFFAVSHATRGGDLQGAGEAAGAALEFARAKEPDAPAQP